MLFEIIVSAIGILAILLMYSKDESIRRFGPLAGMSIQPYFIAAASIVDRTGMWVLTLAYTLSWGVGIYLMWVVPFIAWRKKVKVLWAYNLTALYTDRGFLCYLDTNNKVLREQDTLVTARGTFNVLGCISGVGLIIDSEGVDLVPEDFHIWNPVPAYVRVALKVKGNTKSRNSEHTQDREFDILVYTMPKDRCKELSSLITNHPILTRLQGCEVKSIELKDCAVLNVWDEVQLMIDLGTVRKHISDRMYIGTNTINMSDPRTAYKGMLEDYWYNSRGVAVFDVLNTQGYVAIGIRTLGSDIVTHVRVETIKGYNELSKAIALRIREKGHVATQGEIIRHFLMYLEEAARTSQE